MKHFLRNNFYFLHKAFKIAPLYLILSILLRIVMGIRTAFMSTFFLAYVISCVESEQSLFHVLSFVVISFVVISITYAMQSMFDNLYKPINEEKISQFLQHKIFQRALLTDLEIYDTEEYYTSVVLANNESCNRVLAVIDNVLNLLGSFVSIAAIIGYSLLLDWIVPVIAILAFSIGLSLNQHIAHLRVVYDSDLKKISKRSSMLHRILYLPEYAKDIRITGIRDCVFHLYEETNKAKDQVIYEKGGKISHLLSLETILSASICIDFLVPLYLVFRIFIQKTLIVSQFVAILNGCNQLQLKLEDFTKEIGVFRQNGELIERYRRIEFSTNKIESQNVSKNENANKAFQLLELKNVFFRYSSDNFALRNIDLTIRKGEKIAIVGRNGSGKTTLIKLLLRFYDCHDGSIHYNGMPIQTIPVKEYRQAFSTLFQDFCIYATTVEKNISMSLQVDETKASNAAIRVGLEEISLCMKKIITRELDDDGLSFSGGQLQRLALSRVLYEDHDILIMDEPTSAMDVVFEKQFYDMILHQLADKTILFVSHRLTSAMICDRIIYMENGQIVESGSHAELMELNGRYAKLFHAQATILK